MKFIAFTVKGLEKIVKEEIISEISDAKIIEITDKLVIFETEQNLEELIKLKTIDDLGIFVDKFSFSNKEVLIKEFEKIDFEYIKNNLKEFRKLNNTFSLTIGSSKSVIVVDELKDNLSNLLIQKYDWDFTETNRANFDIRVFINQKVAYISVRLTKESLHNRTNKVASREGSLRSTVAAAMVYLSYRGKNNIKIVDNFCGSGTILCEAFLAGYQVYGGDIDLESVMITRENLKYAKYQNIENIKHLNAIKTNWPDIFFDVAVSNLPWNKQIKTQSITNLYIGTLKEYARIVKSSGVVCLMVHKPELLIKYAKQYFPNSKIESIKLGLLGQNPTIVLINQDQKNIGLVTQPHQS